MTLPLAFAQFADHLVGRGTIATFSPATPPASKFYAEATVVAADSNHKVVFGLCSSIFDVVSDFTASGAGFDNTAGSYPALTGGVFLTMVNGSGNTDGWGGEITPGFSAFTVSDGDVLGIAVDVANKLVWWRNATTNPALWNSASVDPGAGTGGVDFSTIPGGTWFILAGLSSELFGASITPEITFNFGATAFTAAAPTGFVAWGATDTLDPSNANAGLTFSGDKLTISRVTEDNAFGRFTRSTGTH